MQVGFGIGVMIRATKPCHVIAKRKIQPSFNLINGRHCFSKTPTDIYIYIYIGLSAQIAAKKSQEKNERI